MIYKYDIQGMTCNGCRKGVEEALRTIEGVKNVSVSLELQEAHIEMDKKVGVHVFTQVMSNKYTIAEKESITSSNSIDDILIEKSKLRQLFPLFLIFGYITIGAIIHNYQDWTVDEFMLDFMGMFYVVFSFFKLLDLRGFSTSFQMYDPLAKRIAIYSWVYPFIEIGLGVLFLIRFKIYLGLILTILVLGITTIGVTKVLIDKKNIQCACLGTVLRLPMTTATFLENTVMLVMAIWMLIQMYS